VPMHELRDDMVALSDHRVKVHLAVVKQHRFETPMVEDRSGGRMDAEGGAGS